MKLKVYYLDDEELLIDLFIDNFESDEIDLKTFNIPDEAIKEVQKSPPDLFFIDYRMPGINGDEVAMTIDKSIPKFLITGDIDHKTNYNFIKVIRKPYNAREIRAIIQEYLDKMS